MACKAFQRGMSKQKSGRDDSRIQFVHHDTSSSFQQAIEKKCTICERLFAALEREDITNLANTPVVKTSVAGPTTYERAPIGSDNHSAVINFRCRDLIARFVLESLSG